ncbi:MAG: orotidine-5'-phosphate decarboxylase [Deltaproteobacteria bacterium]|nr:orotidine-5'-phosphate decarboxylase [Deltaproteobacteria bacterium]
MTMKRANKTARERVIFALDIGDGWEKALSWVELLAPHVGMFKVGKEAFTHYGRSLVESINSGGGRVFLDLKFHDIPNTVAAAATSATAMGVAMFNIHALGGREMIAAASNAVKSTAIKHGLPKPILLAVTVLSSIDDADLAEMGFSKSVQELSIHLALMAKQGGADGVVASGETIAAIRQACGDDFLIVAPGIREVQTSDDQKRVLTPQRAISLGADYLVIGRPISSATDPVAKCKKIAQEMEAVTGGK